MMPAGSCKIGMHGQILFHGACNDVTFSQVNRLAED